MTRQQENKRSVAVIGAGPMGLAAAYELVKAGRHVKLLERDDRIGGMSAHTDFAGTRIERYYHFVCRPDETTFAYLREFGLEDRLRWVQTKMGFYFNGTLYDWGHPLALLRFPGLGLIDKARYALHVMHAKSIGDWRPYDSLSSTEWLQRWIGPRAYDVLWRSLFHYKFYELLTAAQMRAKMAARAHMAGGVWGPQTDEDSGRLAIAVTQNDESSLVGG
jgi:protoporphyrinogen oxidase